MIALEVRTLSTDLLRGYLISTLGGLPQPDGAVTGPGWRVRFVPLPPVPLGAITVRALRVEVEGEEEEAVTGFLRQQTMRGGG